jgi:hypothetical protein
MENEITSENSGSLAITTESAGYLNSTRKWTTFFSVLGFIFIGFMVIAAFYLMTTFSMMYSNMPFPGMGMIIGIIYIFMGALYFFPIFYLFKFSTHMNNALKLKDSRTLDLAFKNLKSHYKFFGILTIVVLSIYIIGIVCFLIFSMNRY